MPDKATSYLPEIHSLPWHHSTQCLSLCVCVFLSVCVGAWGLKCVKIYMSAFLGVFVCACVYAWFFFSCLCVCVWVCSRPLSSPPEMCGWLMKRWRTWLPPLKRLVPSGCSLPHYPHLTPSHAHAVPTVTHICPLLEDPFQMSTKPYTNMHQCFCWYLYVDWMLTDVNCGHVICVFMQRSINTMSADM